MLCRFRAVSLPAGRPALSLSGDEEQMLEEFSVSGASALLSNVVVVRQATKEATTLG